MSERNGCKQIPFEHRQALATSRLTVTGSADLVGATTPRFLKDGWGADAGAGTGAGLVSPNGFEASCGATGVGVSFSPSSERQSTLGSLPHELIPLSSKWLRQVVIPCSMWPISGQTRKQGKLGRQQQTRCDPRVSVMRAAKIQPMWAINGFNECAQASLNEARTTKFSSIWPTSGFNDVGFKVSLRRQHMFNEVGNP